MMTTRVSVLALAAGLAVLLADVDTVWSADVPFTEHLISASADAAISVFAVDLDSDSDTDILSASQIDDKIAWYESDGGSPPVFTEHVISNTADVASSVFAADLDRDTDIDVLSASREGDEIAWYENDGGTNPNFTKHVISITADGAHSVYAADVNADGCMDVLSASAFDDKIAWYENDGGSPPAFTEHVITTAADFALSVFAIDVDGDGDIDVLSGSRNDNKIAWYENDGVSPPIFTERVISSSAEQALSVFAADLDGDTDTDVLSASNLDDKIAWYENDGGSPPSFIEHVISITADNAYSVFASDVNGDGELDVLSASELDDTVAWYENDGSSPPTFSEHVISTTADGARSVFAADVDGDGDTDVLSASEKDDKIAWYENTSCPSPAVPNIAHVPDDFVTIQGAIDAACPGDEIIVAPGTYNEVINFMGKAITLRSSDGAGVTIIDGCGLNDSVVKCMSGEGPDTLFEGFTVTGGVGWYYPPNRNRWGGGMLNLDSSPTVTRCVFTNNVASDGGGGGMSNLSFSRSSTPSITDCRFLHNTAYQGGGMNNNGPDGAPTSDPVVNRCIFENNFATNGGAGMFNNNGASPLVVNSLFNGNIDGVAGGGMANGFSSPGVVTVINCTFTHNTAGVSGGGMNSGFATALPGQVLIYNSIFWDNSPNQIFGGEGGETIVANSNVQGGWSGISGTDNIDDHPKFFDSNGADNVPGNGDDDLRLLPSSPCIDAGENSVVSEEADLDGNPRIVDGDGDSVAIVDMGAYEFEFCALTDAVEVAKLVASDAAQRDGFGGGVAISGNVLVVGATNQGNAGNNLGYGKAYVFEFDGSAWTPRGELTPSDPEVDKEFGGTVAIDGDTIVVGAGQDGGGISVAKGAAYVFVKPPGGWISTTETAKLTASDRSAGDVFGTYLAVSGNVVIASAINNDDFGGETGSAYIFERPSGGWHNMTETQKLLPVDAAGGDRFGRGVAIDGDTIVLGADQVNTGPGKAYIFEQVSGNWVQTGKLTASDGTGGDRFGLAVAIRGNTVAVGAFGDDDAGANSGSVYLFEKPGTGWANATETTKLRASDGAAKDNLGISVAVNTDETVLAGAYAHRHQSNATGFAYVFAKPAAGWSSGGSPIHETLKLTASDGASGDQFGGSVSLDGEFAVVGANQDDDAGNASGSAYVFELTCNGPPASDAGDPYTCEAGEGTATVTLSGSGSFDPEEDPLTYYWETDCPGGVFDDPTSVNPTLTIDTSGECAITCNVTLTVDDGQASDSSTTTVTVVDATQPTIACPSTQAISSEFGYCGAVVSYLIPVAEDNCPGLIVNQIGGLDSNSFFPVGTTIETYQATDESGNTAECSFAITVEDVEPPTIACPSDVTLQCPADTTAAANGTASGFDNCGDPAIAWSDSITTGCGDTETIIRTWTATDETGNDISCDQAITVVDTNSPTITSLDGSPLLVPVGEPVYFEVHYSDVCGAPHVADWDFGDGSPIMSIDPATIPASADYAYLTAGIFTVTATLTDHCGNSSSSSLVVVVYDPSAGFTTGGGWFVPDPESFVDGELITDTVSKANFGFVVKYKKGADTPDGNLEFIYRAGDINLHSTDMEWLVVQSATKVRFKGQATVNGEGPYTFKVVAEDNGEPGTNDAFQIEIWMGVVDTENGPPAPKHKAKGMLGGGNIKIHE